MLIYKMTAPLQLGWSPSLLSRPGLVLFVGVPERGLIIYKFYLLGEAENSFQPAIELWDSAVEFKRKCIGDVVSTVTITTYPNQKPWMVELAQNWKCEPPHLTMERRLGIWRNTNSVVIPSTRQSNKQNVSTETKWSSNSTAQTWDVCGRVYRQSRTTKGKPAMSWTATSCFQTN